MPQITSIEPAELPAIPRGFPFSPEHVTWPGHHALITYRAEDFNQWVQSVMPWLLDAPLSVMNERVEGKKISDKFELIRFRLETHYRSRSWLSDDKPVTMRSQLEIYEGTRIAHCAFDGPVELPVLKRSDTWQTWMSLTPNELYTQTPDIKRAAHGHVLVAGLGLGWSTLQLLEQPKVRQVTVVEIDPQLLLAFGTPLQEKYGSKLRLVRGDAYTHDWSPYDNAVWDIWPEYRDAKYDGRFAAIKHAMERQHRGCFGWGFDVPDDEDEGERDIWGEISLD